MYLHTSLTSVPAAPIGHSPDAALLAALKPFYRKAYTAEEDSPTAVAAFLDSIGQPGPTDAEWTALFAAAETCGLYGEDVGALVAHAASGGDGDGDGDGDTWAAAMHGAERKYCSWLAGSGGWADAAMGRLAREGARQWRVRRDGAAAFVLQHAEADGGVEAGGMEAGGMEAGGAARQGGAVCAVVDECAARVVEAAVDEVVRGVVERVGHGCRSDALLRLERRADALTASGYAHAKQVLMETLLGL